MRLPLPFKSVRFHSRRNPRGVAIVEALIGGVLLAAGLGVLVTLTTRSINQQRLGEQRIVAAGLIDEMLNAVLAVGPAEYLNVREMAGPCDSPFGDYWFSLEIVFQGDSEPYFVSATVSWTFNGRELSETVDTLMSQPSTRKLDVLREPGIPIVR